MRTRPVLVRAVAGLGLGAAVGAVAALAAPPRRQPAASAGSAAPARGHVGDG